MPGIRYQPLGPLLSGKGSRAFLALEVPEDAPRRARPVVLIWVPEDVVQNPEAVAAIERETQRAVILEHPNIIRVFGLSREKEGLARVVEFADAESLRRVLEVSRRLATGFACRTIADAAIGVHYAHLAGNDDGSPLVHGDLRPETLLVSYAGVTKVSGYGALAVAPREPGGRRVRGRRQHCAPEQVVGGRNAVNVQTDVYLLGITLYELITGFVPFEDEENFDQAVLTQPPPGISEELCPPALARVVKKAMAKKSNERFPSALAFREALEEAMGDLPSQAAFANYLKTFFPEMEPARSARQRMLDEAMARLGGIEPPPPPPESLDAPSPPPAFRPPAASAPPPPPPGPASASPPPPAAAPGTPAATPPRDATARPGHSPAPVAPPQVAGAGARRTARWALLLLALLIAGAAASVYALRRGGPLRLPSAGLLPTPQGLVVHEDGGSSSDGGPPDTSLAGTSGALPEGGLADGGALDAGLAPDAGDAGQPTSVLALTIDPAVDVTDATLDNKPLGRTPFTVPLPPGKHLLRLTDRAKSIYTSRTVSVPDGGTASESIYLSRGFVHVLAPDGAEIFIDGRSYGIAPQREIGVYEGSHKLVVTVGQARWQESFDIKPNERLKFTVDFQ